MAHPAEEERIHRYGQHGPLLDDPDYRVEATVPIRKNPTADVGYFQQQKSEISNTCNSNNSTNSRSFCPKNRP
jgi:hypothetical protein